jgi:hypothetical protein
MATKFVNSNAAGANDGTSWTDAWTSLASSNGVAAGDTVKVEYRHAQTGLAVNINWSNGTLANPVRIISCDKDNSDAPRTGASISFNADGAGPQGNVYCYGCTWISTAAHLRITGAANGRVVYESCNLAPTGTTGIQIGNGDNRCEFRLLNSTIDFSGASNAGARLEGNLGGSCVFLMLGGTFTCRSSQTNLMAFGASGQEWYFTGVNISGTVTNLFGSATTSGVIVKFTNCTGVTFTNVFSTAPTCVTARCNLDGFVIGTLTAALLPPTNQIDITGTVKSKTTPYRTGGANDNSQANPSSWEMAGNSSTLAFTAWLASPAITRWVGTGSQVLKVYVASGGTLNNDEFWIEVVSPSEAGSATAQGKFQSTRLTPLGSPAALTTDALSTWNGSGVGTAQYATVTIAPTIPGPVTIRCYLAKNVTCYVDPVVEVAGNVSGYTRFMEGLAMFAQRFTRARSYLGI